MIDSDGKFMDDKDCSESITIAFSKAAIAELREAKDELGLTSDGDALLVAHSLLQVAKLAKQQGKKLALVDASTLAVEATVEPAKGSVNINLQPDSNFHLKAEANSSAGDIREVERAKRFHEKKWSIKHPFSRR